MAKYILDLTIEVEADSKIEALDKLKSGLSDHVLLELSDEVDYELFEELGVDYD